MVKFLWKLHERTAFKQQQLKHVIFKATLQNCEKATFNFVMPVVLSARMEKLGSH
jgi:hypothetical protein